MGWPTWQPKALPNSSKLRTVPLAQIWCENRTEQVSRVAAKTDPHSPGMFRANGTVRNFDEFGKAFGCHKGQPMMPEDACRVW